MFIVKVSPWFKINVNRNRPQGGFIAVFDAATGHTLAILNEEHYLSDIRTAAAGALAARALAPKAVDDDAVLGAGVQAYWQPQAHFLERRFETLLIWARSQEKAEQLKVRLLGKLPNVKIRVSNDLERTVRQTDLLITATIAREPLVRGEWLREAQHITAVGADDATKCELDAVSAPNGRTYSQPLQKSLWSCPAAMTSSGPWRN